MKSYAFIGLAGVMVLSACAQTPMGSTVQVMPGPNTSLASFQKIKRRAGSSPSRPWETKRKGLIFAGSVRRR